MIDFTKIMKLKQYWNTFCYNHPKVQTFVSDVQAKGFEEGQEVAIALRYPDGTEIKTGIRVKSSDLELLDVLKNIQF